MRDFPTLSTFTIKTMSKPKQIRLKASGGFKDMFILCLLIEHFFNKDLEAIEKLMRNPDAHLFKVTHRDLEARGDQGPLRNLKLGLTQVREGDPA